MSQPTMSKPLPIPPIFWNLYKLPTGNLPNHEKHTKKIVDKIAGFGISQFDGSKNSAQCPIKN